MNRRTKSLATNLVLALASVVVVMAAAELFLRTFPQFMPLEARLRVHWAGQPTALTRADPVTGYVYPPHHHMHFQAGEIDFDFSTDEYGFRNPSPWPDSADVVIVGDSQVFGYGVDDDSVWTRILGRELPNVRVINLGLPGMAPEQYRRVYEKFGLRLHPKLVIFGLLPANDLSDQREFDAWLEAGAPGNFAAWKYVRGNRPAPLRSLLDRSALVWSIIVVTKGLGRSDSVEPYTFPDGSHVRFAPSFAAREAKMAKPDTPEFRSVMESVEKCRQLAKENGAAFLVILFTTKEDVYLPLRGDSAPRLIAPFATALDARGIPYLDLTAPMQAEARKQKRLFLEVDGHPNAAGYRVIANAVLASVRQNAATHHLTDGP